MRVSPVLVGMVLEVAPSKGLEVASLCVNDPLRYV